MRIGKIFEFYLAKNESDNYSDCERRKRFFTPVLDFFKDVELKEISEENISKFLAFDGLKISSQKVRITYAATAVNFAKKSGFIKNVKNPFKYNFSRQEQFRMKTEIREITVNYTELKDFVDFISNPTVRNMCKLALNTGMHSDEICKLQWNHIKDGSIKFTCCETKEKHERTISLSPDCQFLLKDLKQKAIENGGISLFVFLQKDGKAYTANNLSRQINFYFAKFKESCLDVKPITFHAFRRAFIQTCQQTGFISKDVLAECCS